MSIRGVILAAGSGSRMVKEGVQLPKPLYSIGGLSLLERAVRSALKAGVSDVLIVIGANADVIQKTLEPRMASLPVRWVRNDRWETGNGSSVLAVESLIGADDKMLILMADHILLPSTLKNFIEATRDLPHSVMAVDAKRSLLVDPEDATKVRLEGKRITELRKTLNPFNAIDVGAALCTPQLFKAVRDSITPSGSCTHTGGMQVLAKAGELFAFDIGEDRWEDADSTQAARAAEKILLNSLRKPTDGFMSRYVERHLSLFVSKYLARTSVTPNQITCGVVAIGALAAWLFSQHGYLSKVFGALLFWCASFLDGCDGEISRLKFMESRIGGWLDLWSDNLVHMLVFIGIGVGLWRDRGQSHWITLGVVAALGVFFSVAWVSWTVVRKKKSSGPLFTSVSTSNGWLAKLADALSRRDFIFGVIFLSLLDWLSYFLWAAAIGSHAYWLVLVSMALLRR